MASDKFGHKPTTSLGTQKKTPESRSLILKRRIIAGMFTGLIVAVGVGIWQFSFREESFRTGRVSYEIRCSTPNVVVRSSEQSDALIACDAAREAIKFLSSQGMDVSGDIAIELLKKLPPVECSSAAGCYIELERRALILVYSEFIKFKNWFDVPIDRALYRSLVSHEVAHLVADLNFKIPKPSIQAKEYIAYITQFSIMEPLQRERVLTQYPCEAFEGDWEMSTTIYMFDCMRFGVRAYLHFLNLANRRDYLQSILNGKTLVE